MADKVETVRRSINKSLTEQLLTNCSPEHRALFRRVENLARKVVSARWRVVFLRVCLKDKLIPQFIHNNFRSIVVKRNTIPKVEYMLLQISREIEVAVDLSKDLDVRYSALLNEVSLPNDL